MNPIGIKLVTMIRQRRLTVEEANNVALLMSEYNHKTHADRLYEQHGITAAERDRMNDAQINNQALMIVRAGKIAALAIYKAMRGGNPLEHANG